MPQKTYPYLMLALLTGLNILNYIDRNVLFAVQPLVQREFKISDTQIGILSSAFFFCYMLAAPCVGWLGDKVRRKYLVASGILLWSGFTLLTWLVHDYAQLLIRHTIVGIGEASYATIAPTLIADSFPLERRGRMLSIFYLGLPFGSAAGFLIGGYLGPHFNWRVPFMVAGIPGLILGVALLFVPEPPRGQTEAALSTPERTTITGLFRNGAFLTATLGMAMYTFAVGGLQVWIPTFLERVRHVPLPKANLIFGLIAAFNGIVATLLGGWIGDRMLQRNHGAYYLFSAMAMFAAVPLMVLAIFVSGRFMFPAIFLAVFALLIGTAPSNAAVVNSVSANIRSTALAVNVFIIHLLGDAVSPSLIGYVSDRTNLQTGFVPAFFAAGFSGLIMFYGARYAPRLSSSTTFSTSAR